MAAPIAKEILGAGGSALFNLLAPMILKDFGIVLDEEKDRQKLNDIYQILLKMQQQLETVQKSLDQIKVDIAISFLVEPYQYLSTTFDLVCRTVIQMAQHKWQLIMSPNDETAKRELEAARQRFIKLGNDNANKLEANCNIIHNHIMGSLGKKSVIFDLLDNIRNNFTLQGLFQQYLFMKSFLIRYWAAMVKARTMMEWFSHPNSGVNYRPDSDEEESITGALNQIIGQVQAQDDELKRCLGDVSYHFCTFFVNDPEGMWTGPAPHKGVTIYGAHGQDMTKAPWDGWQWHRMVNDDRIGIVVNNRRDGVRIFQECDAIPVCELQPELGLPPDWQKVGWSFGGVGFAKDMQFSYNVGYTFWIMRKDVDPSSPRYLRFGLNGYVEGAAAMANHAVLTKEKAAWHLRAPKGINVDEIEIVFHAPNLPEHGHFVGRNWPNQFTMWRRKNIHDSPHYFGELTLMTSGSPDAETTWKWTPLT